MVVFCLRIYRVYATIQVLMRKNETRRNGKENKMSKYDFEIDLSETSSTGIILRKIQQESTVLEFGCATGRMTRYMKDALNCKVYIVEYEQSAFDEAMQYAVDGVCDDLLTLSWLDKFKDVKFDAIIFADVLEHLSDPAKALCGAKKVLKDDGCIYVSVPNVTHNDILIKAFQNHFDYTKVGLLDDTHVHFWGLENLKPFMQECGLALLNLEATYCETGNTEQYIDCTMEISKQLLNYFNERISGRIYQFVMTLGKQGQPIEYLEKNLKKPYVKSHIYFDRGEGFNEHDLYEVHSELTALGRYNTHFILEDISNVKRLRYDPVENQDCILLYVSIRQDGKELAKGFNNYIDAEVGELLLSTDPMVYVDINSDAGTVIIDAEILVPGDAFVEQLKNLCVSKTVEIQNIIKQKDDTESILQSRINELQQKNQQLQAEIVKAQSEIVEAQSEYAKTANDLNNINLTNYSLQVSIREHELENKHLREQIASLQATNANIQGDLNAYIILAEKKEALLLELQQNSGFFKKVRRKIHAVLRKIKHKVFRSGN